VTRNFRARLKKAAGPLEALTAITWSGRFGRSSGVDGVVLSDGWSRLTGCGFRNTSSFSFEGVVTGSDVTDWELVFSGFIATKISEGFWLFDEAAF
jgi:hypothetical protein